MTNKILLFLLIASGVLFTLTASADLELISTNHVSFGKIYNYFTSTNNFVFVNKGNAPVKILNTLSTCPCINGQTNKQIVPPNEKLILTTFFNAATVHGEFTRGVWLVTDEIKNNRTLVKVTGSVLPLFAGLPNNDIVLHAINENVQFTNTFTIVGLTTNYFLSQPESNDNIVVSAKLETVRGRNNLYKLTTITKPPENRFNNPYINLPIHGPKKVADLKLKFKFIVGAELKASPSKILISDTKKTYTRDINISTSSSDAKINELNYSPHIKGLSIQKEIYVRRKSKFSKTRSVLNHKTRYICEITIKPEALTKLRQMTKPSITFSYPDHKAVDIPLLFHDATTTK